ncbi:MAG: hypothetical protein IPM92_16885 [Saprospiraceae bacterium]|nr:hypothetical protein [Saprospiraceae bacterium]
MDRIRSLAESPKRDELEQDAKAIEDWMHIDSSLKNKAALLLASAKTKILQKNISTAIEDIIDAVHKEPAFQNELPRRAGILLLFVRSATSNESGVPEVV